eukprot:1364628-Ditylum_brightwellii.AAC.1
MASNNPLCPECNICCFSHGLEGDYMWKGCFFANNSAQSVDANSTAPAASINPSTNNTTLHTDASVAAYLSPTAPPDALAASVPPPANDPILSPKGRKSGTGPTPT